MRKKTKIIATLGPSTTSPKILTELIAAGTDVFRLNLSHAKIEDAKGIINNLKASSAKLKRPVAILIDLQGHKIRIKGFSNKQFIDLKSNQNFILDNALKDYEGDDSKVGITYKDLHKNIKINDEILLSDGLIKLKINRIKSNKIHTTVLRGGRLLPFQGLNKKGGGLSLKGLTKKDIADLKKAIKLDIDYIAVSFVRNKDDLIAVKKITDKKNIGLIAKIERNEALENIDSILEHSDGILIARGDLGVEIGIELLPAVQDELIGKAMDHDKLVIVATQMMESMKTNRVPTRAEVFDVSNAACSGVDAIMLSAETAVGEHPIEVVQEACRICDIAEKTSTKKIKTTNSGDSFHKIDQIIAMSAVYGADKSNVKAIAALTETGSTPLWMSRIQSLIPIYAMTVNEKTSRRICLYRGVYSIRLDKIEHDHARANKQVIKLMEKQGAVKKGDLVIITKGDLMGTSGGTNALKIVKVGKLLEV
ncbi:MAG: pyruvate kinase [Gammaproteobacteria bacterium]|nr:pyruvate kinase [Gammaproteobacteria bacterium]